MIGRISELNGDEKRHYLERIKEIYLESFPPDERDPWQDLVDSLQVHNEYEWAEMLIIIDDNTSSLQGFSVFNYSFNFQMAFLSYIAIDKNSRSKGIGSLLFDATCSYVMQRCAVENNSVRGICWEVEKIKERLQLLEVELREKRISFYKRRGALLLDFIQYTVPPLAEGLDEMEYWIMYKPLTELGHNYSSLENLTKIVEMCMVYNYQLEEESPYLKKALFSLKSYLK